MTIAPNHMAPTSPLRTQATFRTVLSAVARPGTVMPIDDVVSPPSPLNPVAAAVLCTLADHDTPLFLDRRLAGRETVMAWLRFHTGAPLAETPANSAFAAIADSAAMPDLSLFAQGSDTYPDESTTIVAQVDHFAGDHRLIVRGPGVADTQAFAPHPLPDGFLDQLNENRNRFPRGVDLVFAGPEAVAALPRSTRVSRGAG